MSFTPNMPTSPQSLGETVDNVRNNFANYFDTISRNHVDPNDLTNGGKHKFCQFPLQGAAPSTAADEIAIYNLSNQLYFKEQNNGASYALTGPSGQATQGTTGFSISLQGGYSMKFGSVPFTTNNAVTVNFATVCGSSFTNPPISLVLNNMQAGSFTFPISPLIIGSTSNTQFVFQGNSSGTAYFIAIGN